MTVSVDLGSWRPKTGRALIVGSPSRAAEACAAAFMAACRTRAGDRPDKGGRHLGSDFFAGAAGDAVKVVLAAVGYDLRLLRAWLIRLVVFLLSLLANGRPMETPHSACLALR
ncbi:hypothetical protein [Falsiroseomonas bella]|uniref:hypothetical protein n=1 Tax=Falsiroseomonas bella TaxID=2184016 RepID=UPI0011B6611E|nr:hypothetical protein [Falsiroseomonas bella]